ncbi:unnamed protein product [Adineta steineri]|uniref:G8 domain-containing protein n=1 Tax=Adineta steineri TaxID=433720 RepID=A0A818RHU8_9BILA|nr:unnamed protein product [Adineta steineri]
MAEQDQFTEAIFNNNQNAHRIKVDDQDEEQDNIVTLPSRLLTQIQKLSRYGSVEQTWDQTIQACPDGFDIGEFAIETCYLGRYGEEIGSDQFSATIMPWSIDCWPTDRLASKVDIVIQGDASVNVLLPNDGESIGPKVYGVLGGLDLHGLPRNVSWTRLGATALSNQNTIVLSEPVDWNVGDEIILTTTDNIITTVLALNYTHIVINEVYSNDRIVHIAGAVGLLTRNIRVINRSPASDLFGFRIYISDYATNIWNPSSSEYLYTYYKGFARVSDTHFIGYGQFVDAPHEDKREGIHMYDLGDWNASRPTYNHRFSPSSDPRSRSTKHLPGQAASPSSHHPNAGSVIPAQPSARSMNPLLSKQLPQSSTDGSHIYVLPIGYSEHGFKDNLYEVYLQRYFQAASRPVHTGDNFLVRAETCGVSFKIIATESSPNCIVTLNTVIDYKGGSIMYINEKALLNNISYNGIGGKQLEIIKNIVDRRESLRNKTLIVPTVANETRSIVHLINGPQLMSQVVDKGWDSFQVLSKTELAIRIRSFTTDNIRPGTVIATTNRQRLIDLPLYPRARFEHEVLINTPDADERFNILGKCTTNMVLANDVDLGKIANATFGYARKLL